MELVLRVFPVALVAAYAVTTALYGVFFFRETPGAGRAAPWALRGTILVHGAYLFLLAWHWGQMPVATAAQAASCLAFAVAVIYSLLEHLGRERVTGLCLAGAAGGFQTLAAVLERPAPPTQELLENPLFGIHAGLALLGFAAFAVAASYGLLFLGLYRELKRRTFSLFFGRLPPLEALERMMTGAMVVGFLALTIALMDGAVWLLQRRPEGALQDPMVLLSLGIWVLYGAVLILRRARRWHGRQTALASLGGLAIIVAWLLGAHALFSGFHRTF